MQNRQQKLEVIEMTITLNLTSLTADYEVQIDRTRWNLNASDLSYTTTSNLAVKGP